MRGKQRERLDPVPVPYHELYDLYSILEDATTAQSVGDPNTCAKNAALAKEMVLRIHEEYGYEEAEVGDSQ